MNGLQGPLHFATVMPYFARADELAGAATLDLAGVTHCDSAGAALLLELRRRALSKGNTLRLVNAPQQLRDLTDFFGIADVLDLAA
ncbi:STAS domain-containing protein [Solimonas marina]|uniref:STAS domain-containing protein n=1 Tax=Solimonas marina TaxID=2714601 RepID=A0A970B7P1_9GAMM|nr:STAS domain-containing protein [Solimonas marina]NKF23885.1 STAS domain-containing protein [Solimonas marina]